MDNRQQGTSPIDDAQGARYRMVLCANRMMDTAVGDGCQFDIQNVRQDGGKWIGDYLCMAANPPFKNGSAEIGVDGKGFKLDLAEEI